MKRLNAKSMFLYASSRKTSDVMFKQIIIKNKVFFMSILLFVYLEIFRFLKDLHF